MAKRKTDLGLGRGLNALLGDPELPTQGEGSISLPISQVEPGLNQPRKRFDPETLSDLAESIRVHGIIQPLTVRRLASGYYQIIAGERRWRAAKQAGLTEVCLLYTSRSPASLAARSRRSPATSSQPPSVRRTVSGWSSPRA